MKTFRCKKGHVAGKTMTVKELRQKLGDYPEDMPVLATWEGVLAYIEPENFSIEEASKGCIEDACECLLVDVEGY